MGWYSLNELIKTTDMTHRVTGGTGQHGGLDNAFHNYIGTDYVLWSQANNSYDYPFQLTYDNGNLTMDATSPNYGMICLPIIPSNIGKIEFDIKFTPYPSGYQTQDFMLILDYDSFSFYRLIKRQPPTITGEWEHIEIDVDEPTETFYFTMTSRCCWEMKNIKFYVVDVSPSGGAGSGYIGNSLLSNKKMVGYNVPTSEAESTKTESVNVYSASGESNKPKAGDGKVKIMLKKSTKTVSLKDVLKTTDFSHIKDYRGSSIPSEELGTDWLFITGQTYGRLPSWDNASEVWYANEDHAHAQYVGGHAFAPVKPCYIHKAKFDLKFTTSYDGNPFAFYVKKIDNNAMASSGTLYALVTQNVDITDYEVTFNPPIRADYFEVYCGGSSADIIYQISNMTLEVIEI